MTVQGGRPLLIMGAGAWGTALAVVIARSGYQVYLWGRDPTQLAALASDRENARYLPGIEFPSTLVPLVTLDALPKSIYAAVLATPLQSTRVTVRQALEHGLRSFICLAKGIELDTQLLVHEIIAEEAGREAPVALVSGPNFAREVAEGRPAALTVATRDDALGNAVVRYLHGPSLRPYRTDDLNGVAVAGAVKNVMAIAAGIADGLTLGANSRAALITRALNEMTRFGVALGGKAETFMGLAGLGDLVLTCTDDQSRNRRFGLALGRGVDPRTAVQDIGLVEGIPTAAAVIARAASVKIEMPICAQVASTLRGECTPEQAVAALMRRELPRAASG
ncbi:MAG: NAD(P)-dependent glycerol-3-phosphate dehydrogenase [Gammaproteobacteria bacterium]|nr:NAD(P)-dependent glycerol-3-phosphate dehydrogenase [Gammaproteobacteria bacterium]